MCGMNEIFSRCHFLTADKHMTGFHREGQAGCTGLNDYLLRSVSLCVYVNSAHRVTNGGDISAGLVWLKDKFMHVRVPPLPHSITALH